MEVGECRLIHRGAALMGAQKKQTRGTPPGHPDGYPRGRTGIVALRPTLTKDKAAQFVPGGLGYGRESCPRALGAASVHKQQGALQVPGAWKVRSLGMIRTRSLDGQDLDCSLGAASSLKEDSQEARQVQGSRAGIRR